MENLRNDLKITAHKPSPCHLAELENIHIDEWKKISISEATHTCNCSRNENLPQ